MCILYRLLLDRAGNFSAALTVLAVSVTAASPIFQAAYAESLTLLLLLIALAGLERRRYLIFGCAGVLLSLSRAVTPALVVTAVAAYFLRAQSHEPFPPRERRGMAISVLVVAVASLAWPFTVGIVTNDPAAYLKTQAAWATVAGNEAEPWLVTMLHNPAQAITVSLVVGVLVLICCKARYWPLTFRLWPVPYALFILAVTPATASALRFSMLTGAAWWPAPGWSKSLASPRARVALMAGVVLVGFVLQWWWLRTYFVIDPYSHGHP
jgi:hypothetical protein